MTRHKRHGFTLIELSIVLVIIGLIVGGVLAGQAMIKASELRALLSQKDKFTTALNIFKEKYKAIPGDMRFSQAAKFGFFTFTGSYAGTVYLGDDDGLIGGIGGYYMEDYCNSECGAFWRHLSDAGLIEGSYGATIEPDTDGPWESIGVPPAGTYPDSATQSLYLPKAKLGAGYWGAYGTENSYQLPQVAGVDTRNNAFYLSLITSPGASTAATISAEDAYSLDLKIDDGKPNSGRMLDLPYKHSTADPVGYYSATVNASSNVCVTSGANAYDIAAVYNANKGTGGDKITCIPVFLW